MSEWAATAPERRAGRKPEITTSCGELRFTMIARSNRGLQAVTLQDAMAPESRTSI
jgi:hypothetical protein